VYIAPARQWFREIINSAIKLSIFRSRSIDHAADHCNARNNRGGLNTRIAWNKRRHLQNSAWRRQCVWLKRDLTRRDVIYERYTFKRAFHVPSVNDRRSREAGSPVRCDENDDVTCRMVNSEEIINVEDASSVKKLTPRHLRHIQGHDLSYLYLSQTRTGWRVRVIINSIIPRTNYPRYDDYVYARTLTFRTNYELFRN